MKDFHPHKDEPSCLYVQLSPCLIGCHQYFASVIPLLQSTPYRVNQPLTKKISLNAMTAQITAGPRTPDQWFCFGEFLQLKKRTQWSVDIWVHYAVTKQRKCALLEHSHPNMYMSWRLNIVWRKQWCTQEIINHPLHFHSLNSNFNRTNISCMISFQSPSNDRQVCSFPIFPFVLSRYY